MPYQPPAALATCYGFWQQFCAHEYLTQALEKLLYCALEGLNLRPSGMTLEDVCSSLAGHDFRSTLVELFGAGATPKDLLAALEMDAIPSEEHCRGARAEIDAASTTSERALVDRDGKPEEVAAAAVACSQSFIQNGEARATNTLGILARRRGRTSGPALCCRH